MAQLEAAGVPGVVLCTTPFERAARLQWSALGYEDGAVVAVAHPVGSMPPDRVLAEAEAAVEALLARLTSAGD